MGISVSFHTHRSAYTTSHYGESTGLSYGTMGSILSLIGLHKEADDLQKHYGFSVDAFKFLRAAEDCLSFRRKFYGPLMGGYNPDHDIKEVCFLRQMVRDYNQFRVEYGHKPRRFGGA